MRRLKALILIVLTTLSLEQQVLSAVTATVVWEFRQGGTSVNNSGCFDPSVAVPGTDRSQQAGSQFNGTDLVIDAVDNTLVTSATHNFDTADEGNCIHITAGTGFTVQWVVILDTAANAATLSSAAGTVGSTGGTWREGGAFPMNSTFEDDIFEALIGGNKVWIKSDGTAFTVGEAISVASTSCDADSPCFIEGYQTTRGDTPTFANSPTLAAGTLATNLGQHKVLSYLNLTTTNASGWAVGALSSILYSKGINSATAAGSVAFSISNGSLGYSEAISQNGIAVSAAGGSTSKVFGSYIHDSNICFQATNPSAVIEGNVLEACRTQAINLTSTSVAAIITHNTVYGREAQIGTGLDLNANPSPANRIFNNIFYGLTTGVDVDTAEQKSNIGDYNDFFNNGTDVTRYTKGANDLAVNPTFAGAAQITGTTATTSGSVLTQASGDFSTVTNNVDYLHVLSGTGVTTGGYLITSHDATTLTVNNALGTSAGGDVTYFVTTGHNFAVGTNLKATGAPSTFGSETNNYLDTGAVQRIEPSAGGSFPFVQ